MTSGIEAYHHVRRAFSPPARRTPSRLFSHSPPSIASISLAERWLSIKQCVSFLHLPARCLDFTFTQSARWHILSFNPPSGSFHKLLRTPTPTTLLPLLPFVSNFTSTRLSASMSTEGSSDSEWDGAATPITPVVIDPTAVTTSSLKALQSGDQRKVLDIVDKLRRTGLSGIVELPQIVGKCYIPALYFKLSQPLTNMCLQSVVTRVQARVPFWRQLLRFRFLAKKTSARVSPLRYFTLYPP